MLKLILAQAMLGLNNGVFYAMLSLGLAVIFGLLNVVNFAHGALYMTGAFLALILYSYLGVWIGIEDLHINFWAALIIVPILIPSVQAMGIDLIRLGDTLSRSAGIAARRG